MLIYALILALVPVLAFGADVPEQRSAEQEAIPIGMSTALSGPASDLGRNMKLGVELAFAEVNEEGGIGGRPIRLIAYDDGYEPEQTIPNMRRLIEQDKVLAIVGNVGTPTAIAAIPIASQSKTLFFGAFTGAGVLRRTPPDRYVINVRAGYAEEISEMIGHLIYDHGYGIHEIAFFTQRDGYGDSGYSAGIDALRRHGLDESVTVLHVRYNRNTLDVEGALAQVLETSTPPKAIIMMGTYGACAKFIRLARQIGLECDFLSVSFVGSRPLAQTLGAFGEGIVITQVVPHYESDLPIVRDYRHALQRRFPDIKPSFVSLEGYIVGKVFVAGLMRVEGTFTREAVVTALESLRQVDVGLGFPVSFGVSDHQASHTIWPTAIANGKVVPIDWEFLRKPRKEPQE